MDKQIVAYLYSGILLRYKKEKNPTDTHNTVNLKKIMLSESIDYIVKYKKMLTSTSLLIFQLKI